MAYRILHTADLHLDRAFASLPTWAARERRAALRRRMEHLLALAAERRVDAVTIGGDLFDAETAAADLGGFLRAAFAATALPIFITPGNHDPAGPGSLYRRVDWPPNVRIFGSQDWEMAGLAPGLELWGTAFLGPERRDNPFGVCSLRSGAVALRLALLHGEAGARLGEGSYAPFEPGDPAAAGFAMALLGHFHQAAADRPGPHPGWLYPGSPEPLDFGETGERGVVLISVDIAGRELVVEQVPLATTRYFTTAVTLEGRVGTRELTIAAQATAAAHAEWRGHYLRFQVEGRAALVDCDNVVGELAAATGAALVLLEDRTVAPWDMDMLAREGTIRGAFVRSLRRQLDTAPDTEREVWRQALAFGLDALAGVPLAAP